MALPGHGFGINGHYVPLAPCGCRAIDPARNKMSTQGSASWADRMEVEFGLGVGQQVAGPTSEPTSEATDNSVRSASTARGIHRGQRAVSALDRSFSSLKVQPDVCCPLMQLTEANMAAHNRSDKTRLGFEFETSSGRGIRIPMWKEPSQAPSTSATSWVHVPEAPLPGITLEYLGNWAEEADPDYSSSLDKDLD